MARTYRRTDRRTAERTDRRADTVKVQRRANRAERTNRQTARTGQDS